MLGTFPLCRGTAYYLNKVFSTAVLISKTIACVHIVFIVQQIIQIVQCLHKSLHHHGAFATVCQLCAHCAAFLIQQQYFPLTFSYPLVIFSVFFPFLWSFFSVSVCASHFLAAANSNKQLKAKNKHK